MTKWLCAVWLLAVGCGTTEHWYFAKAEVDAPAPWSYAEDGDGPAQWADLSPSYAIARTGKKQSPVNVNVPRAQVTTLPPIQFAYREEKAAFVNQGFAIQGSGSYLEYDGERYRLEQFHFHTPSEHTVNNEHARIEVQLVHRAGVAPEAKYVIVSVLGERGAEDERLGESARQMMQADGVARTVRPMRLLPEKHDYFRYEGSFTTPPTTEGVTWLVMRQRIRVASTVLGRIREVTGENNRPLQALYGRRVQVGK